jgi:hypothetical protein
VARRQVELTENVTAAVERARAKKQRSLELAQKELREHKCRMEGLARRTPKVHVQRPPMPVETHEMKSSPHGVERATCAYCGSNSRRGR